MQHDKYVYFNNSYHFHFHVDKHPIKTKIVKLLYIKNIILSQSNLQCTMIEQRKENKVAICNIFIIITKGKWKIPSIKNNSYFE